MNNHPVKISANEQKGKEKKKEDVDKVADEENKAKKDKTGKRRGSGGAVLGDINDD